MAAAPAAPRMAAAAAGSVGMLAGVEAGVGVEAWIEEACAAGRGAVTATALVLPVTAEAAALGVAEGAAAAGVAATQGGAAAGQQTISAVIHHLLAHVARYGALQMHTLLTVWLCTRTCSALGV
jgi:hypothetical protein